MCVRDDKGGVSVTETIYLGGMNTDIETVMVANEVRRERRSMSPISYITLVALPMMAMGGDSFMRKRNLGIHRGEYRKPKNTNNDPRRAKGMRAFDVDGVTIYAGTIKAARKKARILAKQAP